MDFRFDTGNVRRIQTTVPCEFSTTDGTQVIIRTPDVGWSVTRRRGWRTVKVLRPAQADRGVHQVAHASGSASVHQAGRDMIAGSAPICTAAETPRVMILLPAGCRQPEVTSL